MAGGAQAVIKKALIQCSFLLSPLFIPWLINGTNEQDSFARSSLALSALLVVSGLMIINMLNTIPNKHVFYQSSRSNLLVSEIAQVRQNKKRSSHGTTIFYYVACIFSALTQNGMHAHSHYLIC